MVGVVRKTGGRLESIATVTTGFLFLSVGFVTLSLWSVSCEWACDRSPSLSIAMIAFIIGFAFLGLAVFRAGDFR
jgi:hypothetical protein